ncbi:MAG: DUF2378 family protein [Myxococcota bacterium]
MAACPPPSCSGGHGRSTSIPASRAIDVDTGWRLLELAAEMLAPEQTTEDAFREMGREVLRGFESSVVRKTSFLVLRLLGTRRGIMKVADSFRSADNVTTVEVAETGPKSASARVLVPGGLRHPSSAEGIFLEGLAPLGAKEPRLNFRPDERDGTFDVGWT